MSPDTTPHLDSDEPSLQALIDGDPPYVPEEVPQVVRLAKQYDVALIGGTVSPYGVDRFAYSLVRLIQFEMGRLRCTAQEARESIAENLMRPLWENHGDTSPVFIDDELVQGAVDADDDKPRIILPPDFDPAN